ncbi:TPA: T3SS effector NleG family protein, partial [Escherichia coli]
RLHSCSFLVNIEEMSYIDEALQCPITLAIPQRGVFLRNAEGSRVCSLYDEMALSRIINDGMHHPLSREPITLSMLVAREQCEFDCSIGHFTVRSDCYSE